MHMEAIGHKNEALDVRALTDTELNEVNGGLLFLALGLVACFEVGFIGGVVAANYAETGNMWGDID
jgi:hypothetical protein